MVDISFEHEDEVKLIIGVPVTPADITFKQFLEFTNYDDESINAIRDRKETFPKLLKAVEAVVGGDLEVLPFQSGDEPSDIVDQGYFITPGDELSIIRIYAHIWEVIRSYEPKERQGLDYICDYVGKSWAITGQRAVRLFTEAAALVWTTGDHIELQEWRRQFNRQKDGSGDPTGELAFRLGLNELAILLRHREEKLPYWVSERQKFLTERSQALQSIGLDKILDIRHYLIDLIEAYLEDSETVPFEQVKVKVPQKGFKITS